MRIRLNKRPVGVVLIAALAIIVTAGIVVAGYLTLMQAETRNVARSQTWNQCVPVMEAGVEEALSQVRVFETNTMYATNNWTLGANGYYTKTNHIGTDGSYYQVSIQPSAPPVIYATAYVPVPASTNYITRQVRVTTKNQLWAVGGLMAKGLITFKGNGLLDSFNSNLGPYNTNNNGLGSNALALTITNCAGAISMPGGAIFGMAVTGPGGTVSAGSGSVGPQGWAPNTPGIDPGWSDNDANVQIDDVIMTTNTNSWHTVLSGGTNNGIGYTYILADDNYAPGNLSMSGGNMLVQGNCILYVHNLKVTGTAVITLATSSSLTIYASGTVGIGGGGIVNGTGLAASLTILGLPSCSSVGIAGGAPFIGVVNAPEADLTFGGNSDSYGKFTAGSITVSGGGGIHYDLALGGLTYYVANSWNEL